MIMSGYLKSDLKEVKLKELSQGRKKGGTKN